MNSKVDEYINNAKKWQNELQALRSIILECGLVEDFKWRNPCYTYNGSNLIIIGGFKEYCVISFFKGALLNDSNKILIQQTENSQSARIIKFTSVKEIEKITPILKAYIFEAIETEKAGLKVEFNKSTNLVYPIELQNKLDSDASFKSSFEALTPGRKRAYNMYFTAAKQSATRVSRIEQYTNRILNGKGINDCVCGLSKRMPNCDGSHKYL